MTISLEAFAKVNLSLLVLGKRADGFHELDTIFQTIDLADRLTFEAAPALELQVDDPSLPTGDDNLVMRAARALQQTTGHRGGARIALEKRIPHGAG
ncbi:MAG: 4-(cytidine 5'-diphospho)-2-C-methyl-D-erythritol kinase, partial [Thermoanaerobaculia bacterium]